MKTIMRGHLKALDGSCIQLSTVYSLAVGRDPNCDLVLTVSKINIQHKDIKIYKDNYTSTAVIQTQLDCSSPTWHN